MLKMFLDGYDQGYADGLAWATAQPGERNVKPTIDTLGEDASTNTARPAYQQGFVDGLLDGTLAMAAVSTAGHWQRTAVNTAETTIDDRFSLRALVQRYFQLLRHRSGDQTLRVAATQLHSLLRSYQEQRKEHDRRTQCFSVPPALPQTEPYRACDQVGQPTLMASQNHIIGGGTIGALVRTFDWTATPFGPIPDWPTSLRTMVNVMVNSQFPTLMFWGPELRMLYNEASLSIIGDTYPASFGQPVSKSWPEAWPSVGSMLEQVLTTGHATWSEDLLLPVVYNGVSTLRSFTFSFSPIHDEAGAIGGVFCPVLETTERKRQDRLLTELQRINTEFQQFSYIVSHDLSEPLRTIRTSIQLLAQQSDGSLTTAAAEDMALISDAAQRLQHMLSDLLAYTRADQPLQFYPVNCEVVLTQVLSSLQTRITECEAVITYDPLPTVQGDATRLGQVLQNLISNALKFCEEHPPRIHISASKDEHHWRFTVQDNGIGIAPQQVERLFQVFQRLHPYSAYPGSGIGLAICKRIVEQHGGRIWVESQPGHGSLFSFTIDARNSLQA